ncbi:MAG: D-tyrosyl-tRNA(Tyr) deacylase [Myxococcales bacterium]|nr:D-tyrosyl-tRNA(Tyr) deacylase [Myxococcales bacterium]
MRAVVQRVHGAKVVVQGEVTGEIGRGLLVYLGAAEGDGEADLDYMVNKIEGLRVFPDEEDRMSRSVVDVGGAILVVSQFTLFGDVRRGRRPSFDGAAPPDHARQLYEALVERLRARGRVVETGRFRAMMEVHSSGDGPVTILLDSRKLF